MHNLLDLYCQILYPNEKKNTYLVIAIDDLDLNIGKAYDMLEEIRRYLLDWRIIILLAVDYEQMEKVCEAHFYKEFSMKGFSGKEGDMERHISKLSDSYIIKMMPIPNRIYIAEEILREAKIKCQSTKQDNVLLEVKEYLLFEIAKKMYIYYDAYGLKKHFCEKENMRGLISYVQFLDSLHRVDWKTPREGEKQEMQLEFYNQNYIRFVQDIEERMVFELLRSRQRIIFEEIRKRDLKRRTGYVLQWYENSLKKTETQEIAEREHFDFDELLECIYYWGRKDYEYKPLVHCLIAFFTCEATKEYFNYRYSLNEKNRLQSKGRLEGYIGDNISGIWLSGGLRENEKERNIMENSRLELELMESINSDAILIKRKINTDDIEFKFEVSIDKGKRPEEKYIQVITQLTQQKVLPILQCIFLCLSNYKINEGRNDGKPQIDIVKGRRANLKDRAEDNREWLVIRISGASIVDFDVLGFVRKSLDYKQWVDGMDKQLTEGILKYVEEIADYSPKEDKSGNLDKKISEFVESSIFANVDLGECEMALPVGF